MTENSKSPPLPWKIRLSVSFLCAFTDFACLNDGTVNRRLLCLFDTIAKVPPQTSNGVKVSDVTVDSTRNLWFRLFVPTSISDNLNKLPILVYFHGGGFVFLSAGEQIYDTLCRRFALEIPAIIVSVNYRLAPEYRFPAQYDDGYDTLKFLDNNTFDGFPGNVDMSQCFLVGDSAGGNLAHNVACRVAETESKFCQLKVIGLIAIQPYFGGEERTESENRLTKDPFITVKRTDWWWKAFLPEGEDRDHQAVNVFGPKSTDISGLKSFPSTLVFVGGFDPLQDWQRRYYEGLKRSGKNVHLIEYPNGIHAFFFHPELPETSLLIREVCNFIRSNGDVI